MLADKEQLEKALANEKTIKALKGEIEELQVAQQEELAAQKEETQAAIDSAVATESSQRKVMGETIAGGSVLLLLGTVGTAYFATKLYQDIQAMKVGEKAELNRRSVSEVDMNQKKGVLNNIKGGLQNAKNKWNESPKLRAGLRALGTIGAFSAAVTGVAMIATSGAGLQFREPSRPRTGHWCSAIRGSLRSLKRSFLTTTSARDSFCLFREPASFIGRTIHARFSPD